MNETCTCHVSVKAAKASERWRAVVGNSVIVGLRSWRHIRSCTVTTINRSLERAGAVASVSAVVGWLAVAWLSVSRVLSCAIAVLVVVAWVVGSVAAIVATLLAAVSVAVS